MKKRDRPKRAAAGGERAKPVAEPEALDGALLEEDESMLQIGRWRGSGSVGTDRVRYDLRILQRDKGVSDLSRPDSISRGPRKVEGIIKPVVGPLGVRLTLQMADGRKIDFMYERISGDVIGIGAPRSEPI